METSEQLIIYQGLRSEKSLELLKLKFEIEDLEKKLDNIKNKLFVESFKNPTITNEKQRQAYVMLEIENQETCPEYNITLNSLRELKIKEKGLQTNLDDIHEQIRNLLHLSRNEPF